MLPICRTAVLALALTGAGVAPALAQGDPENGEKVFRRCKACHVIDAETNRLGPYLVGVYGREAGKVEGYSYSRGLVEAEFVWDEQTLDPWLADPKAVIPNTKMVLKLSKPEDRADVIAYLKSMSEQ